MEILGKLFGSSEKVKIMRLFLFNPEQPFDLEGVASKTKSGVREVRREISELDKIGLVKKRIFFKDVKKESGKKTEVIKKKTNGWILDNSFPYLAALQGLLINAQLIRHGDILKRLSR